MRRKDRRQFTVVCHATSLLIVPRVRRDLLAVRRRPSTTPPRLARGGAIAERMAAAPDREVLRECRDSLSAGRFADCLFWAQEWEERFAWKLADRPRRGLDGGWRVCTPCDRRLDAGYIPHRAGQVAAALR